MEATLKSFFEAINGNDVDAALACCDDDEISCTYPDPGRNWKGKERGRVVMTAIFGQLARVGWKASFEIVSQDDTARTIQTREFWGHANMKIVTTYTFTTDNKILSMAS